MPIILEAWRPRSSYQQLLCLAQLALSSGRGRIRASFWVLCMKNLILMTYLPPQGFNTNHSWGWVSLTDTIIHTVPVYLPRNQEQIPSVLCHHSRTSKWFLPSESCQATGSKQRRKNSPCGWPGGAAPSWLLMEAFLSPSFSM